MCDIGRAAERYGMRKCVKIGGRACKMRSSGLNIALQAETSRALAAVGCVHN